MTDDVSRLGIIDLGSNTARLVVYDYVPGRWFRLVGQIRETERLGFSPSLSPLRQTG